MTRFGRHIRHEWPLDPDVTYLNHGTVGVTPRRVMAAQTELRDAIERQPSRFMLRDLTGHRVGRTTVDTPLIRHAASCVAEFLGARGEDLVFVDNITTGANAVLRSFPFEPGDELLVSEFAYGGITRAAQFAARQRQAVVRTAAMPYPITAHTNLVEPFIAAISNRTRLAIVDHVAPQAAVILPVAEIVKQCQARGVAVLVDGAHVPGALALDISSLGADWYAANLHKWMWAPRSSGILWAPPHRQAGLSPTVTSWGLDEGFAAEFDTPGTRDPSPHLTAPVAIDLMREWGVDDIRAYNHQLAWTAARELAERWQVAFDTPEPLVGTMATIPLPTRLGTTPEDATRLRDTLLYRDNIEVPIHASRGQLHVRVSAQVYNDSSDIERLADAVHREVEA